MDKLVDLPKYRIGESVRYMKAKATVEDCFWGGDVWRYEVYIRRGKNKGYWGVREDNVQDC